MTQITKLLPIAILVGLFLYVGYLHMSINTLKAELENSKKSSYIYEVSLDQCINDYKVQNDAIAEMNKLYTQRDVEFAKWKNKADADKYAEVYEAIETTKAAKSVVVYEQGECDEVLSTIDALRTVNLNR